MVTWENITYEQLLRVLKSQMATKQYTANQMFADLEGISLKQVRNMKQEDFLKAYASKYNFGNQPNLIDRPEFVTWKDKQYKTPVDMGYLSVGQFEDIKAIIEAYSETPEEVFVSYPRMFAIWLQGEVDGEYDYPKAMELEKEIWPSPGVQVYQLGFFFTLKYKELLLGMLEDSRKA